jgi:hypothetical protein
LDKATRVLIVNGDCASTPSHRAGAAAGAIVGAVMGAIICVAIGLATFGIGAALCLLIVAAAILIGTAADGILGDALGGVAVSIADDLSDFDKRGEAITKGCIMTFTGRWITDSNHQHNEMHDISSAQLIDCNDCQNDTTGTDILMAAVGIGRHPTGRDP